jgi:hypothetical protein
MPENPTQIECRQRAKATRRQPQYGKPIHLPIYFSSATPQPTITARTMA